MRLAYTLEIDNWQIKIKHKEIGYNLKIEVSHWFDTERSVQYCRTYSIEARFLEKIDTRFFYLPTFIKSY